MSAAHTPGPWTLNPVEGVPMIGFDVQDGGDLLPIVDTVHGRTKAVARANAKLIAAAPQLAEALRKVFNSFGYAPGRGPEWYEATRAALTAAGVTP